MQTQESFSMGQFFKSRTGLVLLGFLALAAFYLLTEHTAHLFGVLPYALLLLCPLLHLFMHGGHGDHSGQSGHEGHTDHEQHNTQVSVRVQNPERDNNG
jgi:hypothetical protein